MNSLARSRFHSIDTSWQSNAFHCQLVSIVHKTILIMLCNPCLTVSSPVDPIFDNISVVSKFYVYKVLYFCNRG